MFERIHARLEDLYVKLLKHIEATKLISELHPCGEDFVVGENDMTGSPEQLMKAVKIIRDATGLSELNVDSKPLDTEGNTNLSTLHLYDGTVYILSFLGSIRCVYKPIGVAERIISVTKTYLV